MTVSGVGIGIDADTGRRISGWEHVVQSLRDIFVTRFGSRYAREWYGSFVPEALGRLINPQEMLPVIASITSAIEQWEPRFRVLNVEVGGDIRAGHLDLTIIGRYRPRALLGDFTEEGERRLSLAVTSGTITFS